MNLRIKNDFESAVRQFWSLASDNNDVDKSLIIEAADHSFLLADSLKMNVNEDQNIETDEQLSQIRSYLNDNNIVMNNKVQTTGTGKKTYRVLNRPSRFDA